MASNSAGPLLDIVLPTHNVGQWLAAALDSLNAQSSIQWRAFIVLDGCTDDSERIARDRAARDPRVTVHESGRRGVGIARNLGFALGSAPYVAFVDPDDLVTPRGLSALVESLERSGSDIATGHAVQFREQSHDWPYWTMASGLFESSITATTVRAEPRLILDHTTWNKVYRRSFLADHDIRFPEDAAIGEDAHHTIEAICAAESIDVLATTVYRHRVRPNSLTAVIRNSSSVSEWVRMTRGIYALVLAVQSPSVTAVWLTRMLENEAWTRARQAAGLRDDLSLEPLLSLLRELCAATPAATWERFPLVIRWGYDALGVSGRSDTQYDVDAQAEHARSVAELEGATTLPEFTRFERELKLAGPTLRARLWRESLLTPFVRVIAGLNKAERRRARARVLAFHDRFVAAHALLPGEDPLIAMIRSERYAELESWSSAHRSMTGTASARWEPLGMLALHMELRLPPDFSTETVSVVAVSQGRIAGLTRPLCAFPVDASHGPQASVGLALTETLRLHTLRPYGQWAVGALCRTADGGSHFIPLTLVRSHVSGLPGKLRMLVQASAVGRPFLVESKASARRRVFTKLRNHRVVRGALGRSRAAARRLAWPAFRS